MTDTYQNTEQWIKGIQKLAGLPGNQSPTLKQIAQVPTVERNPQAQVTPPPSS